MEIGTTVPLAELKAAMEDWFRRKSYLAKDSALRVEGINVASAMGAGTLARPTHLVPSTA